mmetsp:Transcript_25852/g.82243  ORF Transcript_25852/g.82243 Transcript_25852/m.82243 type:complete len:220 (-) Transcript_25852:549-1208(-)
MTPRGGLSPPSTRRSTGRSCRISSGTRRLCVMMPSPRHEAPRGRAGRSATLRSPRDCSRTRRRRTPRTGTGRGGPLPRTAWPPARAPAGAWSPAAPQLGGSCPPRGGRTTRRAQQWCGRGHPRPWAAVAAGGGPLRAWGAVAGAGPRRPREGRRPRYSRSAGSFARPTYRTGACGPLPPRRPATRAPCLHPWRGASRRRRRRCVRRATTRTTRTVRWNA